jgi:hypothetical protein
MSSIRKRIATIALATCMALLAFTSTLALPSSALAWNNCPKGLVNDPYPGACNRYVDTNGDDICDLSQPKPTAITTTTLGQTTATTVKREETTTTVTAAATAATSGEPPTGDCPLGPCAGCGACLSISVPVVASQDANNAVAAASASAVALSSLGSSATTSTTIPSSGGARTDATDATATSVTTATSTTEDSGGFTLFTHYNISPIAIAFFLVYAVSFVLHKTKRIRLATHRKVWNVLLAATFLITGIFGLILTIQLDYPLPFTIPFDLLFWHVEAGAVMTFISLFHLGWHFKYYRNLLRTSRAKTRTARETEKIRDTEKCRLAWEARAAKRQGRHLEGDYAQSTRSAGGSQHGDRSRRPPIRPRNEVEPEM